MKVIFLNVLFLVRIFSVISHKIQAEETKPDKKFHVQETNNYKKKFLASWESLDSRTPPTWYDEAKIGIFVHWGVFSVPGVFSEWFWYRWHKKWRKPTIFMERNYPPGFQYADFGTQLKAELFNANQWAKLVARSGAKLVH